MASNPRDDQPTATLPTDEYSVAYRRLGDHPEAVRASSTITLADFFGRSETWVVETFRAEGTETNLFATDGGRGVVPAHAAARRDRDDRAPT